jgi:quercetin dioxygenase-like cupin family protein/2-polyprenyl-3-methyl-5-hydroxy-6-metoxy-1,4-benzoquinol methylase
MTGVSPRWEDPRTVAGFVSGEPNHQLITFARRFLDPARTARCLDLGCGTARNALPLAEMGFDVTGTDLSMPMLRAAGERAARHPTRLPVTFMHASMAPLPFASHTFDLIVAHGIWNLARSGNEFRSAVTEAARVARPGAGLFVFTFSRHTLAADAKPDAGESIVFSSWNGDPQCFLTEDELLVELARVGFTRDSTAPLTEYNRPRPDAVQVSGPPVIYEGTFVMSQIDYQAGGIVSKQLLKTPNGNVTLFAFDAGQALSEHSSPYEALVFVTEGEAEITIAGQRQLVPAGESVRLPANVPHGVQAPSRFKMTLTMMRA